MCEYLDITKHAPRIYSHNSFHIKTFMILCVHYALFLCNNRCVHRIFTISLLLSKYYKIFIFIYTCKDFKRYQFHSLLLFIPQIAFSENCIH